MEQISQDQYGLKVKLPGGNVANRVLPILIHDLDKGDIKLCESVIDGVIRGIEFIYKEPGVNRPLRPADDRTQNLVKTDYRNQINKVANAIKDVLGSLTEKELSGDEAIAEEAEVAVDKSISPKRPLRKKAREVPSVSFLYKFKNLTTLSRKAWRIVAVVFLFLLVSLGTFWLARETAPPPPRARITYNIPLTNTLFATHKQALAISPNGESLVYVMNDELNLKSLLDIDEPSEPIPDTRRCRSPFFSPDGKWIGLERYQFDMPYMIMKVPIQGGRVIPICELDGVPNGINWYENEIIFAIGKSIYRVPDTGGSPELLYPLNRSENDPIVWNPQLLPDNKTLLFNQLRKDGNWNIMTWQLESKESPVVLVDRGRDGRFLNSGQIVYSQDQRLYVRGFNPKTNRIINEPKIITTRPVFGRSVNFIGGSQFEFSENGILVYYEHFEERSSNLVWRDNSNTITPITRDAKNYGSAAISSDGQSIAVDFLPEGGDWQIEIIDTKLKTSQIFTKAARCPVWSKDNSSIIYVVGNQVFQQSLVPGTSVDTLFKLYGANSINLGSLSKDGMYLTFHAQFPERSNDIGYYDIINSKYEMLEDYNTDVGDLCPVISPDGKWIAFASEGHGLRFNEIYVAPFPGPGVIEKVTVDRESGSALCPQWAPDMTALYYLTNLPDYELWKVKVQPLENFSHDIPESIFNGGNKFSLGNNFTESDLEIHSDPDGDRFLVKQKEGVEGKGYVLKVVVNWEQEFIDE